MRSVVTSLTGFISAFIPSESGSVSLIRIRNTALRDTGNCTLPLLSPYANCYNFPCVRVTIFSSYNSKRARIAALICKLAAEQNPGTEFRFPDIPFNEPGQGSDGEEEEDEEEEGDDDERDDYRSDDDDHVERPDDDDDEEEEDDDRSAGYSNSEDDFDRDAIYGNQASRSNSSRSV